MAHEGDDGWLDLDDNGWLDDEEEESAEGGAPGTPTGEIENEVLVF